MCCAVPPLASTLRHLKLIALAADFTKLIGMTLLHAMQLTRNSYQAATTDAGAMPRVVGPYQLVVLVANADGGMVQLLTVRACWTEFGSGCV